MKITAGTLFFGLSIILHSIESSVQSSEKEPGGRQISGLTRSPSPPTSRDKAESPPVRFHSYSARSTYPADDTPSSPGRPCVLEKIVRAAAGERNKGRPVDLKYVVFPPNRQFQIRMSVNGPFRAIEPNEYLPAVSYRSTGEIIGILDDNDIFHALYESSSEQRLHILEMRDVESIIKEVGILEDFYFRDCGMRKVR